MSIRKIKDAKDLSDGSLIYFKGHAMATYMSNGSTVEDAINNIKIGTGGDSPNNTTTQIIELSKGWNWVSFYVETSLEKLQNALGTNGIEIKYMDFTTSYDEELGLWLSAGNPLTFIDPSKMYMINTNNACVIELEGKLLEDVEITLNQGENYISYPLKQELDINTALQNLDATQGDNIKGYGTTSIATYYNGKWAGPLTTLQPGQGYQYTSNSSETLIFKYPDSIDLKLSDYTTKEYVGEEINKINTKIDSFHNKTAIQTIELTEGWNSVSFYVDITLEQLQEALGNNALQIKDENSRKFIQYSQELGWYGSLKELVKGRYYEINTISSYKIVLTGTLLYPNEITYVIGAGYSYIGYPLNYKLNINTAFKSIEPQEGDYLSTRVNGETQIISQYSEGVWNGIQQLVPGQGYTYYSNSTTNKSFTYPSVEIDFISFVTENDLKSELNKKQDTLVSGTNIKTINGESLLGEGNINISGAGWSILKMEASNIGDIAYWNGRSVKTIPLSSWNTSLGTPIGVVVIPNRFLPDGKARIMSLTNMTYNENEYIAWDPTDDIDTPVINHNVLALTDNEGSSLVGTDYYGYLPSDRTDDEWLNAIQSYDDPLAKYNEYADLFIPSPYLSNGIFNTAYAVELEGGNALSDFNGLSNTQLLVNEGEQYHAAHACWNYKDNANSNLKWYLPAIGELGFLMSRFELINNTLQRLSDMNVISDIVDIDNEFWSSSEVFMGEDHYRAYDLLTYDGSIDSKIKYYECLVRSFALL